MSQKNPLPKPSQYHFCVRITPKTLSMSIFQSKGIQSLYKLQIDKGSKKQTYEVMQRNIHQQALQGFYKSQKCYFTLSNYTNLRPYEMKIIFSEINNSTSQQDVIFVYKFSTFGIVKNFLENGVRRSTHVVTVDYQTEFYIDLYIQSNKKGLEEKVNLDGNMQNLRKRYVQDSEQQTDAILEKIGMNDSFYEKNSNRNSMKSNYTPSKSSHKNSQSLHRVNSQNLSFTGPIHRESMPPMYKNSNQSRPKRRNLISNDGMEDSRSEKVSHSKSKKHGSSHKDLHVNQKMFMKKSPSTKLSVGEFGNSYKVENQSLRERRDNSFHISNKPSFQFSQQCSIRTNELSQMALQNQNSQLRKRNQNQTILQLIYDVKNMTADQIVYRFRKNLAFLLFLLLIIFIVLSKTFDVANLESGKYVSKKQKTANKNKRFYKINEFQDQQLLINSKKSPKRQKKQKAKKNTQKKKSKTHKKFKGVLKSF